MTTRRKAARVRGFTLLELCAVVTTLGLTLGLGSIILLVAMRANQVGSATLLEVRLRVDVGDTFRADVARAVSAPDKLGAWARSPTCVLLRQANGDAVIYEWQNDHLSRTVQSGERTDRSELSLGIPNIAVEFDQHDGHWPVLTMRITEPLHHGIDRHSEFSAALGGDRR
jgi:type II secretory pathway pseudopilin PulG